MRLYVLRARARGVFAVRYAWVRHSEPVQRTR